MKRVPWSETKRRIETGEAAIESSCQGAPYPCLAVKEGHVSGQSQVKCQKEVFSHFGLSGRLDELQRAQTQLKCFFYRFQLRGDLFLDDIPQTDQ